MSGWRSRRSTGTARGAGSRSALLTWVTVDVVARLQPVVPSALACVRSKPPSKKPQVMLRSFSMSPMFFCPDISAVALRVSRRRRPGRSRRPAVQTPWPSGTMGPLRIGAVLLERHSRAAGGRRWSGRRSD